jgi:hypothetical protein
MKHRANNVAVKNDPFMDLTVEIVKQAFITAKQRNMCPSCLLSSLIEFCTGNLLSQLGGMDGDNITSAGESMLDMLMHEAIQQAASMTNAEASELWEAPTCH